MNAVLDLFSGIGGFGLAVRRSGFGRVVGYCEVDPFCQEVLAARIADGRLDDAPIHDDIRTLDPIAFRGVDLVTAGFPCQDLSVAGSRKGLSGDRSGLWSEVVRILRGVRPRYVLVENVPGLLDNAAMGQVLADLAGIGFDAEWSCVSGCSVGAPHVRRRVFIVAHTNGLNGRQGLRDSATLQGPPIQTRNGFEGARARWRARMANPSELYGGADGIPDRMDRNRGIGNAIVPQVAEAILRTMFA